MRLLMICAVPLLLAHEAALGAYSAPERRPVDLGALASISEEMKLCTSSSRARNIYIDACTKQLEQANLTPEDRAWYLHFRSRYKEDIGDLPGALADIDEAAKYNPKSWQIDAQRCWLRAALNIELDQASRICANVIEREGPSARVIDSLSLIQFRKGNYTKAHSGYLAANANYNWAPALYGQKLSLTAAIAGAAHNAELKLKADRLKELLGEVDSSLEQIAKAEPDELADAAAIFARMGLTVETAQAIGAKPD